MLRKLPPKYTGRASVPSSQFLRIVTSLITVKQYQSVYDTKTRQLTVLQSIELLQISTAACACINSKHNFFLCVDSYNPHRQHWDTELFHHHESACTPLLESYFPSLISGNHQSALQFYTFHSSRLFKWNHLFVYMYSIYLFEIRFFGGCCSSA